MLVKIEIKRYEEGYTYTLLRFLRTEEELERMQNEYPFPLEIIPLTLKFFPEEQLKDYKVEGTEDWYYMRPNLLNILKLK